MKAVPLVNSGQTVSPRAGEGPRDSPAPLLPEASAAKANTPPTRHSPARAIPRRIPPS